VAHNHPRAAIINVFKSAVQTERVCRAVEPRSQMSLIRSLRGSSAILRASRLAIPVSCALRSTAPAFPLRSFSSSSHPDFAPKIKTVPVSGTSEAEIFKKIEAAVKSHRVFLFMKGVPALPQCGFSNKVVQILSAYNVEYGSFNVLDDMEVREAVKKFSNWPTFPQLYVNGELVGGADILTQLHNSNELASILSPK
jgi:monothiol glutaredoxin